MLGHSEWKLKLQTFQNSLKCKEAFVKTASKKSLVTALPFSKKIWHLFLMQAIHCGAIIPCNNITLNATQNGFSQAEC